MPQCQTCQYSTPSKNWGDLCVNEEKTANLCASCVAQCLKLNPEGNCAWYTLAPMSVQDYYGAGEPFKTENDNVKENRQIRLDREKALTLYRHLSGAKKVIGDLLGVEDERKT